MKRPAAPPDLRAALAAVQPDPRRPGVPDGVARTRSSHRVMLLGTAIAAGYLALTGQASSIMLLPDPQLESKAKVQFEEVVEVRGRRGDIYDRNGALLATTVDLVAVHVDPSLLTAEARAAVAEAVAPALRDEAPAVARRLAIPGRRDVLLSRGMTPADARALSERIRALAADHPTVRGASWEAGEPYRFYPGVEEGGALLGLVSRNGVGTAGIERTFDHTLRGGIHKYVVWRDRKGRRVTPETARADEGMSIVTTIDRRIQHAADVAVERALVLTGAEAAHAVVLEVPTGDVLAVANRPTANPNETIGFDMGRFKNRAAMDAFEPGSVFKPFIAAAALEEGVVTPDTRVDCEGGAWAVGNKIIHDDHPHGVVTVSEVIKYSSNIGAAKLAFKLGGDKSIKYLTDFGFGRRSGLDLPGETRGLLREPKRIRPIELATTAYGHGVSATSVQLASAMATLGNDGVRMRPRLVREIRDSHGEIVERFEPERDRQVLSRETARQVVAMMVGVTETGGTGTRARVPGYAVAGKTGTAWKHVDGAYSSTARIGSFVGLIPADAPRLAIAVVVDTPTIGSKYGGIVASPAFAELAGAAVRYLGLPPDPALLAEDGKVEKTEDEVLTEGPTAPPELILVEGGGLRAPDLTGLSLRDALSTLQGAGLAVRVEGTGRVIGQRPFAGAVLAAGDDVTVYLR